MLYEYTLVFHQSIAGDVRNGKQGILQQGRFDHLKFQSNLSPWNSFFFQNEAEKGAAASVMSEENKLSCLVTQEKKSLAPGHCMGPVVLQ